MFVYETIYEIVKLIVKRYAKVFVICEMVCESIYVMMIWKVNDDELHIQSNKYDQT